MYTLLFYLSFPRQVKKLLWLNKEGGGGRFCLKCIRKASSLAPFEATRRYGWRAGGVRGELENVYGDPVSLWESNRILWLE